jgi:hypothetical protein
MEESVIGNWYEVVHIRSCPVTTDREVPEGLTVRRVNIVFRSWACVTREEQRGSGSVSLKVVDEDVIVIVLH